MATRKTKLLRLAAVAGVGAVIAALSQAPQLVATIGLMPTAKAQQPLAVAPMPADRHFVGAAFTAGEALAEIRELARRKAQHPALRSYVANSPPAGGVLLEPLRARHPHVPAQATATLDYLQPLSGLTFDRAAMDVEIRQQQLLVELAEEEARAGADPELRSLAAAAVPGLRRDLAQAHAVAMQLATVPLAPARSLANGRSADVAPGLAPSPVEPAAADRSPQTTDLNLRMLQQIERNNAENAAARAAASPPRLAPVGLPPVTLTSPGLPPVYPQR